MPGIPHQVLPVEDAQPPPAGKSLDPSSIRNQPQALDASPVRSRGGDGESEVASARADQHRMERVTRRGRQVLARDDQRTGFDAHPDAPRSGGAHPGPNLEHSEPRTY